MLVPLFDEMAFCSFLPRNANYQAGLHLLLLLGACIVGAQQVVLSPAKSTTRDLLLQATSISKPSGSQGLSILQGKELELDSAEQDVERKPLIINHGRCNLASSKYGSETGLRHRIGQVL